MAGNNGDGKKKRFADKPKSSSVKIGKKPQLNRNVSMKMIWNLENPRMEGRQIVDGQERFYPIHEYDKKKRNRYMEYRPRS